ncbi:MAG: sigma-70 family RNA polymerase sigma factor [Rhodospirillaceae bacterium]|nr:sigma-70 family RNA polymerase sigma factor [Rhodospirillaceae bacterium]
MTILHNLHIQQARSRSRAIDDVALEQDMENRASMPPDQEDGLNVRDLSRALDALEDQHREIILLIGLSGLSYKQTAEVLEIPVGTVMSRLARGRERLRVLMSEGATPTLRRVK